MNVRGRGRIAGLGDSHNVVRLVAENDRSRSDFGKPNVEGDAFFREADHLPVGNRHRDAPWMILAERSVPSAVPRCRVLAPGSLARLGHSQARVGRGTWAVAR